MGCLYRHGEFPVTGGNQAEIRLDKEDCQEC